MHDKCRGCSDMRYRSCPAPGIITNGLLRCEVKAAVGEVKAVCSHCGDPLILGRFAYEASWKEFWCVDCMRELLEEE